MGAALATFVAVTIESAIDAAAAAGVISVADTLSIEAITTTIADGLLETAFGSATIDISGISASSAISAGAAYGFTTFGYILGDSLLEGSILAAGAGGIAGTVYSLKNYQPKAIKTYFDRPLSLAQLVSNTQPIYKYVGFRRPNAQRRRLQPAAHARLRRVYSRTSSPRRLRTANGHRGNSRKRQRAVRSKKVVTKRRRMDGPKRSLRKSSRKRKVL